MSSLWKVLAGMIGAEDRLRVGNKAVFVVIVEGVCVMMGVEDRLRLWEKAIAVVVVGSARGNDGCSRQVTCGE